MPSEPLERARTSLQGLSIGDAFGETLFGGCRTLVCVESNAPKLDTKFGFESLSERFGEGASGGTKMLRRVMCGGHVLAVVFGIAAIRFPPNL